jgi:hypothetical protein
MAAEIPDHIKQIARLHDPDEFERRFQELIPEHPTYEMAYEAVESEYESQFCRTKYAGYNSFRVARSNRIKRKRAKGSEP